MKTTIKIAAVLLTAAFVLLNPLALCLASSPVSNSHPCCPAGKDTSEKIPASCCAMLPVPVGSAAVASVIVTPAQILVETLNAPLHESQVISLPAWGYRSNCIGLLRLHQLLI